MFLFHNLSFFQDDLFYFLKYGSERIRNGDNAQHVFTGSCGSYGRGRVSRGLREILCALVY